MPQAQHHDGPNTALPDACARNLAAVSACTPGCKQMPVLSLSCSVLCRDKQTKQLSREHCPPLTTDRLTETAMKSLAAAALLPYRQGRNCAAGTSADARHSTHLVNTWSTGRFGSSSRRPCNTVIEPPSLSAIPLAATSRFATSATRVLPSTPTTCIQGVYQALHTPSRGFHALALVS